MYQFLSSISLNLFMLLWQDLLIFFSERQQLLIPHLHSWFIKMIGIWSQIRSVSGSLWLQRAYSRKYCYIFFFLFNCAQSIFSLSPPLFLLHTHTVLSLVAPSLHAYASTASTVMTSYAQLNGRFTKKQNCVLWLHLLWKNKDGGRGSRLHTGWVTHGLVIEDIKNLASEEN